MPKSARLLGFSGLLPVIIGLLAAIFHPARDIQLISTALTLLYGGLILSFIGGAWWGLAVRTSAQGALGKWLVLSVLPSLYVWPIVAYAWVAAGYSKAALGLSLGFGLALQVDKRLAKTGVAPTWWMSLRTPLSSAMALLFFALAANSYL